MRDSWKQSFKLLSGPAAEARSLADSLIPTRIKLTITAVAVIIIISVILLLSSG